MNETLWARKKSQTAKEKQNEEEIKESGRGGDGWGGTARTALAKQTMARVKSDKGQLPHLVSPDAKRWHLGHAKAFLWWAAVKRLLNQNFCETKLKDFGVKKPRQHSLGEAILKRKVAAREAAAAQKGAVQSAPESRQDPPAKGAEGEGGGVAEANANPKDSKGAQRTDQDIIKCLAPTHLGDFALPGLDLRRKGINRIGNLLAPNENYCKFEDWITPILNAMHDEQEKDGVVWTPSKMIHRFGKEIDNPESVCYWAYRNNVPIFSPAITDGSIGDMLYFHSYKRSGFVLDLVQDIRAVNDQAMKARKTGVLVLGGGLVKHHCMNANLMRNGADFVVYVSTAQEFDGSDSGARPDEAVSWGKIRVDAQPVKARRRDFVASMRWDGLQTLLGEAETG
ncbi:Deoxyhypusine synthase (DHS) [Durusdinium trenchii]|uniref:Deoxyhypusine synthase (DHS) n=1 Tax=Durusdinium trenchii TaxID=1381693 RepID=A0ABP0I8N6_9DINO